MKDGVDDKVRKSEKETGHSIGVWSEPFATKQRIKDESSIWQGFDRSHVCGGYCSRVRSASLAKGGIEGIVVGTIETSVCILNPRAGIGRGMGMGMDRGMYNGRSLRKSQIPAGGMRQILVNYQRYFKHIIHTILYEADKKGHQGSRKSTTSSCNFLANIESSGSRAIVVKRLSSYDAHMSRFKIIRHWMKWNLPETCGRRDLW